MSGQRQLMMAGGKSDIVTPVNPTGNSWKGWTFSASGKVDLSRDAYKAFTTSLDEYSGCWHSNQVNSESLNGGNVWLRWDSPSPYKIKKYSLQSRANYSGELEEQNAPLPQEWYLQGSNNGGNSWTTLDHQSLTDKPVPEELLTFAAAESGLYSSYRLLITANFNMRYVNIGRFIGYR